MCTRYNCVSSGHTVPAKVRSHHPSAGQRRLRRGDRVVQRLGGQSQGGWLRHWGPCRCAGSGHHKPCKTLLGVLRHKGCRPPHRCPLQSRLGIFTTAAACISPQGQALGDGGEMCVKWRESAGNARAEAAAVTSPSTTCSPRGEQSDFMALSA